jgi:hypothetical protein
LLFEGLPTLIFDFLVDFALRKAKEPSPERPPEPQLRPPNPRKYSVLPLIALGALAGFITYLVFPQRMFTLVSFPGMSLIVSPLATGLVMKAFGDWRRNQGKKHSAVATFWGGATLAFSMAAVRFLLVYFD